mmetsp:Transcript_39402/g.112478  ORF Transcript_39402/g.112478 Transcript_39402/m.112478 type:complete len:449 (+) Transcript_39402:58-1404(+)
MSGLGAGELKALEAAVEKLKGDPTLIYTPDLAFFKEFLMACGAKIPDAPPKKANCEQSCCHEEPKAKEKAKPAAKEPEPPVEEEEPDEPEEPEEPEEEDPDRLPEDSPPFPEQGPAGEIELTDEQMDAQGAAKQAAVEALEDGKLEEALQKYTEAIKIGNVSAMMYAKRAELLLKLKRPNACIADCTAAIGVNPDSGKAYRIRGKAHRRLGHWEDAHKDLSMGQKLDFDDDTIDIQKLVADKFKKISERQTRIRLREERIAKKRKEADYKRRKAEAHRAYEEAKKAEAEDQGGFGGFPGGMPGGFPGGFPGMPGGMPGGFPGMPGGMGGMGGMPGGLDPSMLQGLLSDPDLMAAFQNPKIAQAMQDIMSNPANVAKYQDDPDVMRLFNKMMSKMGGGAGMPGGMGGMPGGMGGMPGGAGAGGAGAAARESAGPTVEEVTEENDVNGVD